MTPDEWRRVKAIAGDALAVDEASRDAFVHARCGADAALRREVTSLLAAAMAAADLFESPGLTTAAALAVLTDMESDSPSRVGHQIGPYRVLGELGRGGMGAAYVAERADQAYRRRVAIKVIKRGMDTDAVISRFLHERQILADLTHPNIAMLLDGGSTADGLPYFVMEYVEGTPIDAFCRDRQLPIADRLELFRSVCEAVHYAHENRVIHRDLKPGNILVTADGVPKLLDFGIAKLLDGDANSQTREATIFARAMTPQYASPEQLRGGPVTPASDVYSLGVLLYELLAGRPPYRIVGLTREEAERLVCDVMPPPPSRAAPLDGPGTPAPPGEARRELAGGLDAIVMTCLRKDPGLRYPSARALSDDIARHRAGQPVTARAERFASRAGRSFRGRRAGWTALAASLVLAIAALLIALGPPGSPADDGPVESVAILPLATSGSDPELDYLSDGITEEVIRRLSRAPGVKVIARDSAYRYKGRTVDPREVGSDLDVQTIVTGRLVHHAGMLTVSVELVDTRDRRQIWGEQYHRAASDVQLLQADLAQAIADGLRIPFTSDDRARLAREHSHDSEAYELYLKGRYFWNRRTVPDFHKSIEHFHRAIARDPGFALAYTGLADALSLLTEYHGALPADTYPEVARAANRALELDGQLAETHTSVAYMKHFFEWDSAGAEAAFQRALGLNPQYVTARQWYAELLSSLGRHDEALAQIRLAHAIDPVSLIVNAAEAHLLYLAQRYDEAIAQCRRVIEMEPNFPEVYEYLKRSLDQTGAYSEAIDARQTRRRILGLDTRATEALRAAATATTPAAYWRSRLEQEIAESRSEGILPFEFAEILAQTGDIPGSLHWLERACAQSDFMTMYVHTIPTLAPIRGERRYADLAARGCAVAASRR